jgi:hypothetical protein
VLEWQGTPALKKSRVSVRDSDYGDNETYLGKQSAFADYLTMGRIDEHSHAIRPEQVGRNTPGSEQGFRATVTPKTRFLSPAEPNRG